ncbi:MAG TPA: AAA family ATPase [Conexibacter sp.]|nr:AAA family ATPase [Conexibacter sp.]
MRDSGRSRVLLERERELAQIAALMDEACSGDGRFLVIAASAGMGKTRLLEAARHAAPANLRVLTARGTELERTFPFALVRQLFEPPLAVMAREEYELLFDGAAAAARSVLRPELDDQRAPRLEDRFGILHGLYWLTAALAERRPLLFAVDDLHWADDPSLDFFGFLLPRLEELPVLLAVACRPKEPGAPRGVLQLVTDPTAQHLSPQPLSHEATAALLGAELGTDADGSFAAACHDVSGGNPFLLSELIQALSARAVAPSADQAAVARDIAPDRVAQTVLARLGRLLPQARTVARSLAILGDDSEHGLVAALSELDVRTALSAADALRAASILDPDESLRFIHPLIRTALHAEIPSGERTAAHIAAAALLRSRGAPSGRLANHLLSSDAQGDRETVVTLLDASIQTLAGGAPESAVAYLLRALREPAPADLRAAVLQGLMTAAIRAADYGVYDAVATEIRSELESSPHLLSRWARLLAVWLALGGRVDEAVPLLERAIDAALHENAVGRAFRLDAQLCSFARLSPTEVRPRFERYRDSIEHDSPNGRLAAAFDAGWSLIHGEADSAMAVARHALQDGRIFAEQPDILAPGWAMMALWAGGAVEDASVAAEQALSVARERGAAPEIAAAWWLRGCTAAAGGDLIAAEADHRQALHIARLGGFRATIPTLIGSLATVLIERGALHEAASLLEQLGAGDRPVVWFSVPGFYRGGLLLAQGRLVQAAEQMLALQRRLEEWGLDGMPFMQPRILAARAMAGLGDHERARELAEAELVHAKRWGAPWPIARVYCALALSMESADRIAMLQRAVEMLEGHSRALERAQALSELGMALRRARQRAAAREPLREALELARQCGAMGLARAVHHELEATGATVRRYAPIGVESLTASERRVAEMAADGMTNREIAQTLFLTVKTIETHLSAVYDKLGVRSRRLLPGALNGRRGVDGLPSSLHEAELR